MASVRQRVLLAAIPVIVAGTSYAFFTAAVARADGFFARPGDGHCEPPAPIGTRQVCRHDRLWPPYPRPTGERMGCIEAYHAAHYWPWPYVCWDRQSVMDYSSIQVANGWITEATLYDYHFDPETQVLNQAGLMHLRWILECVPPDRRCAWVQATTESAMSQQRLANVRNQMIALVGQENAPPVMLRVETPYGRPAGEIDTIRRSFMSTMPAPRIVYENPTLGK